MERIFLIGFMGSGKSTIGSELCARLHADFADTDAYIEEMQGRLIKDIFAVEGEAYFRDLETRAIQEVSGTVVSTGGGIVERKENITAMKERGKIVYLHASFPEISRRLAGDETRPLWKQDEQEKEKLFNRRQPLYEEAADLTVKTDGKDVEQIVSDIIAGLGIVHKQA